MIAEWLPYAGAAVWVGGMYLAAGADSRDRQRRLAAEAAAADAAAAEAAARELAGKDVAVVSVVAVAGQWGKPVHTKGLTVDVGPRQGVWRP